MRASKDGTPSNEGDIDARDKEHVEQLVAEYLFWVNKGRRMQDLADAFVVDNGAATPPLAERLRSACGSESAGSWSRWRRAATWSRSEASWRRPSATYWTRP